MFVVELSYESMPQASAPPEAAPAAPDGLAERVQEAHAPVGDILGLTALLQQSTLDERQRACIEQIRSAAEALRQTLQAPALSPPSPASPEAAPAAGGAKPYVTEQFVRAEPRDRSGSGPSRETVPLFGVEGDEALHGLHVLIVDGDSTHCWLLRDQAAAWGMIPHPFIGAEEALNWLGRNTTCDLAIVDEDLPEMHGHELARRLKALQPGLPVILVSTHQELDEADAPFEVWLTKPYRQRLLLDTMCELVHRAASHEETPVEAGSTEEEADEEDAASPWAVLDPADPALTFVDEVLRASRKSVGELLQHVIHETEEPVAAAIQTLHTNCQLLDLPRLLTLSTQVQDAAGNDVASMKPSLDALRAELDALIEQLDEHRQQHSSRPVPVLQGAGV